jgi:hypothetical protein
MKNKEIAKEYVDSIYFQTEGEKLLRDALTVLGAQIEIMDVSRHVSEPYERLVSYVLGQSNKEWVDWWIYETDFGTRSMSFSIERIKYDSQELTFEDFFEIVNKE